MRIGLSFDGGDRDYESYPDALHRRASALGIPLQTEWLAGAGRPARLELLESLDGIVFTGGPDVDPRRYGLADARGVGKVDTERDAVEWGMLERLAAVPLPILAVCRGAQLLNVFYGGSLIPDLDALNATHRRNDFGRRAHDVAIEPGTLLHTLTGGATLAAVNSSHHQAVNRLASGFRVSATSPDGVVEAFERAAPRSAPLFLAVQWHPEAMEAGLPLADALLDALLSARVS